MILQQLQPVSRCQLRAWGVKPSAVCRKVCTAAVGRRTVLGGLCCCSGCACSHRSQWYDRWFAFNMAVGMEEYEAAIQPIKQQLFAQLLATPQQQPASSSSLSNGPISLLEVGIGTGPNLPYYSAGGVSYSSRSSHDRSSSSSGPSVSVTGLEPNTAMWGYAREAAAAAGMGGQQLQLVDGDAQQMPFDSNSFDAAVVTLVLCSIPQPQAVLSELLRVLKPGGQLLLIEHVIAPQLGLLQLQQRLLDPLQRLLADNCHLTRNTAAVVLASSFMPQPLPPLPVGPGVLAAGAAAAGQGPAAGGNGNIGAGGGQGGDGFSSSKGLGLPGVVNGTHDLWRFEVEGMGLIAPHVAGILRKAL